MVAPAPGTWHLRGIGRFPRVPNHGMRRTRPCAPARGVRRSADGSITESMSSLQSRGRPGLPLLPGVRSGTNPDAVYVEPEPDPEPVPEPEKKKRGRKQKAGPAAPAPTSPEAYSYSYASYAAIEGPPEVNPRAKKRSAGRLRGFLLFLILVGGAVGAMFYWNEHPTIAEGHIPAGSRGRPSGTATSGTPGSAPKRRKSRSCWPRYRAAQLRPRSRQSARTGS